LRCCNRKKKEDFLETSEEISSDSDTDFKIPFSVLSTEEKETRLCYLWSRMIQRARGASSLVSKLKNLREKIAIFGQAKKQKQTLKEKELKDQKPTCLIDPKTSVWKNYWNLYISVLLIYSVIFVPVKVSFFDESSTGMIAWDFIVDASFATDIIFTFLTGYEKKDQTVETDKRVIAQQYLKMWFWIDILSTFPVGIFEMGFF
jgi:hypothetical protein